MRYFTIEEANSILPQIKLLVEEIKEKREKLYEIIENYEMELEEKNDELEIMFFKTQIKEMNDNINELIEIIESFGIFVKGLDPFLIDFPAQYNEKTIYLCWREDEEEIEYWHGVDEGFAGRKHISLLTDTSKNKYKI